MKKQRPLTLQPAARCKAISLLLLWLISVPLAAQTSDDPMPGDYRVVEGQVDPGTYTGWRLFHTTCYGCHGVGGGGTDLAPNLLERIKTLTPRGFATKVLTSYRIVLPETDVNGSDASAVREAMIEDIMRRRRNGRGQVVMPAWRGDPSVTPHVLDLYAYLLARSDGALGPGEPRLMTAKKSPEKAP
jgi:Cytochrome C oxidase, cbb3-type, subunit III